MNDTFHMNFFGGYKWKSFSEIKTHLVTKGADGSCTGTVIFLNAIFQNMPEKLVVLLHRCKVKFAVYKIEKSFNDVRNL